ncbi:phosphatidylglycerophosphatase A family protein [Sulfurospirillum arcachonense]|uniref:phosphatidylglycerophosphatase A family protein n=1 Tax=Sulfurospirillum arcachonense TaxID=57666 RepID=UPI00046AAFC8|nr:phosphatidylglycerophosphatase A [Sulfurospirillum arcachonense]
MRKFFLTFFYTGLSPWAPGTVGSLAAAVVGVVILQYFTIDTLFLLTLLITIVGIKEINIYEKITGTHDDKSIVIDEVAGLWLAFTFASANFTQIILSFIFFRIFDIWKPSLIGRIDRDVKGGLGVMGDDLLAGLLAGICSIATWQFIQQIL